MLNVDPPCRRRWRVVCAVLIASTGMIGPVDGETTTSADPSPAAREAEADPVADSRNTLIEARRRAAHRQRRVIFNDDTEELSHEGADTPEGFLAPRLKPLLGTHVDTISWSILGTAGDAPAYDSKIQRVYGDAHGGPPPNRIRMARNIKTLLEAGHCPFQIVVEFAHDNDLEVWGHVRMNDVHDSFQHGHRTIWKKQHPELLVDTTGMLPDKKLYITSQDFTHEEVRQRKFEIIEEICQRYDVDGFELDYIRHPVLFSRAMRGLPATDQQIQIMTSLMRRIRQLTDETAEGRGRPILLVTRVPDTFELSKNIGLDVRAWIEEDLVDIVIVGGGYAPFTLRPREVIETAHRNDVLVYPCINAGRLSDETLHIERALSAKWYRAGADGIYLWNLGTSFEAMSGEKMTSRRKRAYACLDEIGEPKALADKDKLYKADGPVFVHYTFVSGTPPLPATLQSNPAAGVSVEIADDIAAAKRADRLDSVHMEMKLTGPVSQDSLVLMLNHQPLSGGTWQVGSNEEGEHQVEYDLSGVSWNIGDNAFAARLKNDPPAPVQWTDLHLSVVYKKQQGHRKEDTRQAARKVRVGLIKAVPVVWNVEANWRTFESLALEAVERGAQIICTPECFLDGYPTENGKAQLSMQRLEQVSQSIEASEYIRRTRQFAGQHNVYVVFGFSERSADGIHNAAALIGPGGELLGSYHKTHLLNGEDRWYRPGERLPVWKTELGNIGIMICMDRNFSEVPRTLKLRGADLIMVPSYGGWSLANEWKMRTRAYDNECFMCFVHPKVGFIVGPRGELAEKLTGPEPGVLVYDIDLSTITSIKTPHRRPELYVK